MTELQADTESRLPLVAEALGYAGGVLAIAAGIYLARVLWPGLSTGGVLAFAAGVHARRIDRDDLDQRNRFVDVVLSDRLSWRVALAALSRCAPSSQRNPAAPSSQRNHVAGA